MPTLHRESNWKVAVYANEHGVPHFHVESPEGRCSVSVEAMKVMAGEVPPRILRAAISWASEHKAELHDKWLELNP